MTKGHATEDRVGCKGDHGECCVDNNSHRVRLSATGGDAHVSAYEQFQVVVVVVMLAVFAMLYAADRYPHVAWLRKIREIFPRVPEEQRRKNAGRASALAGAELILLGVALPFGFLALKVMMFSDISTTEVVLVGAGSLLCIGLGITAIWTSRR